MDYFDMYGYTVSGFIKIYFDLDMQKQKWAVIIYDHLKDKILKNEIECILTELGIGKHLKAYFYIQELMTESAFDLHMRPCGVLYNVVANRLNVSASGIDRAIRHGVDYIRKNGNDEYLYRLCGVSDFDRKSRIANYELLSSIHHEYLSRMELVEYLIKKAG